MNYLQLFQGICQARLLIKVVTEPIDEFGKQQTIVGLEHNPQRIDELNTQQARPAKYASMNSAIVTNNAIAIF